MNYLTICLQNGTLINLQLEISSQGTVLPEDEVNKTRMWMSKPGEVKFEPR